MKNYKKALCGLLSVLMVVSLFTAVPFTSSAKQTPKTALGATPDEPQSPIKSIEVDDVTMIEGIDADGAYKIKDDITYYYSKYYPSPKFRLNLEDGTVVESEDDGWIYYNGAFDRIDVETDQSIDNVWHKGKYTATAEFNGFKAEFKVTLEESPVEDVNFSDVDVYEGIDSYRDRDYVGDNIVYWDRYEYTPVYSVKFKDGTVLESDSEGRIFKDKEKEIIYGGPYCTEDQTIKNPWKVGAHKVKALILGVEKEFTVNVKENPIAKVEVTSPTLYDEVDVDYFDGYKHFYYSPEYKVTFKDGTVYEPDEDGAIKINGNYKYASYEDDQSKDNIWGVGTHKAVITVCGVSQKFEITVKENPVEKVEAEDVTLIEGVDLDDATYWDEDDEEHFWSRYVYAPKFKVTFEDGTVLDSKDGAVVYNGITYRISVTDDQSYHNQWKKGTYDAAGVIFGRDCEFKVNIVENPVKSVKVEDLTIKEGENQKYDYEFDKTVYIVKPAVTVTLNDGTILTPNDNYKIEYEGAEYPIIISDYQETTDWKAGNTYDATAYVLNESVAFKVSIISAPEPETTEPATTEPAATEPVTEPVATTAPETQPVTEAKTTVKISPAKKTIYVGKSFTIKADVENGKGVTSFKSSAPKVASVDSKGKVTGLKKGTASITVINNGVSKVCKVTVKNPKLFKSKKTIKKGKTFKIKIIGKSGKVKFKSSNKKVAAVSKTGKIKAKKKGKATITVTVGKIKLKFKVKVK